MRRALLREAATLVACTSLPLAAVATDQWPTKAVRLVVPFPPGGGADAIARILAVELSKQLGRQMIVDNRAGGNMFIGAVEVQRSPPTGDTFLLTLDSLLTVNPFAYEKLPYDPKSFVPVSLVTTQAQWYVSRPGLGIKSMAELLKLTKLRPGALNYGYGSPSAHLSVELLKSLTGAQITLVPYKGSAAAAVALLSGEIDFLAADLASLAQHIKAGKMVALGQTGQRRSAVLPDVPTMLEQGLKGFESLAWFAIYAPAGTSAEIVQRMNAEVVRALGREDIKRQIQELGYDPAASTPTALATRARDDSARWQQIIRASNFKLD